MDKGNLLVPTPERENRWERSSHSLFVLHHSLFISFAAVKYAFGGLLFARTRKKHPSIHPFGRFKIGFIPGLRLHL
jgi:hypothetical protein